MKTEELCYGKVEHIAPLDDNYIGEHWYSFCVECDAEAYVLSEPHIKDKQDD